MEESSIMYDTVLCVSPRHSFLALIAVRSIALFTKTRKIFIITARSHFDFFERNLEASLPIHLLDEDELIESVDLCSIQDILQQRIGLSRRAGWYFQQFLKMALCYRSDVANYYLIWDSDTVLLKPMNFFDESGKVLVNPRTENHQPYFYLIKNLLGIRKQVDFSFISEHFMVKKAYMQELIGKVSEQSAGRGSWVETILNRIEDQELQKSGFSEYETYGNYIAALYRKSFDCRVLKSTRSGATLYGMNPDKYDLFRLMQSGYEFVTFEGWYPRSKRQIFKNKLHSRVHYLVCSLTNRCGTQREAASKLYQPITEPIKMQS
jgi:hypothetical protein